MTVENREGQLAEKNIDDTNLFHFTTQCNHANFSSFWRKYFIIIILVKL